MATTGIRDGFELDDHGILRDSFASDFHVDEHGILHDDHDLLKQAITTTTGSHCTDSGISGDKPTGSTYALPQGQASFDDDLAPIGDDSINISDFEASRDDLDSNEGDLDHHREKRSRSHHRGQGVEGGWGGAGGQGVVGSGGEELFSEEYYQQLRELGVLVDGTDFSRDESETDLEVQSSQLSQHHHHDEYGEDHRDLIGEYLQGGYGEGGEPKKLGRSHSHDGTSVPSVSGFSEVASDDLDMMYSASQTADDDEIFLINRHLLPGSSKIQAEKLPVSPSDHGSRPGSMAAADRSQSPGNRGQNYRSRQSPSPSENGREVTLSRSGANTPHRTSRPDSAISFTSAASESLRPLSEASSTLGKSSMSKAHSQESFFEHGKQPAKSGGGGGGRGEKHHAKRMLPKPSTADPGQSHHRVKSKSVSNIASRHAPLKPTHMTISEITRATLEEAAAAGGGGDASVSAGEMTLDKSEGELTTQLKQESSKRKQATELVQQLQKEYDTLLSKYALAELTIDQMRLGARITLHVDSPTPSSVQSGGMSPSLGGHKAQLFTLPTPSAQRAVVSGSVSAGNGPTHTSTQSQTAADARALSASTTGAEKTLMAVRNSLDAGGQGSLGGDSEDRTSIKTAGSAETVKLTIQAQTTTLNDRLDQFHTLLENRQLTLEEQEKAFENIRTDHEKLRRSYLQVKEDYNVLRRSGAGLPDADFDGNKELEGQLFRLGMRFDEVHEKVDLNLKHQATRRQPFQSTRMTEDQADEGMDSVDHGSQQESKQVNQSEDAELGKRTGHLHEEYRALMDRYRRLKQMAPAPELNKETDNLVRKLNSICVEMPEMFRLAPEVQERWEKIQRRDQRRSPLPHSREEGAVGGARHKDHNRRSSLSSNSKLRGTPLMGDHSISPYPSHRRDNSRDSRMDDSFSRTPSSLGGSRSDLNSSTIALRSSDSPSPRDLDRGESPRSVDGAAAPRDRRDSYDARINRPRRHHHHHDFRDPKSSKRPERGSFSSLADSGLSDQEDRDRDRHHHDALAQLPGPGKMKQLTHQRQENDMDSGFVGSMVSTEGTGQQQQAPPPQPTLRLRERPPADRNHERSRRDSAASSSTVTSSRRGSGNERSSHGARLLTVAPSTSTSTSAGVGHHSIDRSYEGELDESTLSHAHHPDPRSRGARPKEPMGRPKAALAREEPKGDKSRGKTSEAELSGSLSARSQSDSMQDDGTLEDVTGDISDVSTPRLIEPSTNESQTKKMSTQPSQSSQYAPPRPSTPLAPTTSRPPTPYRLEPKEEAEAVNGSQAEASRVEEKKPHGEQKQQKQEGASPPKSQTLTPSQPKQQPTAERPESRGEPTTDLYHTRPRRERNRERGLNDAESVISVESSRPRSRRGRRGSDSSLRARGEDRAVGSDVEVASDLTHVSSAHSARLRAMQDEIEKLKHGVQLAHEKASERHTPPPLQFPPQPSAEPPTQQQPQGPEYYDPFDDPYGFMHMPRRRANSFSGGRVREFDEWYWTLPNERRNNQDDIPLGYAAADAYNRHYREKTPEAARQRLRQRRGERRRAGGGGEVPPNVVDPREVVTGGEQGMVAGQTPTLFAAAAPPSSSTLTPGVQPQIRRPSAARDPQSLFNYNVPSRKGQRLQQEGTATPNPNFNPYRQHTTPLSTSQPNLSETLAGVEPSNTSYLQQQQPWYTIRRSPWSSSTASHRPQEAYYAHMQQDYQPHPHSYYQQAASSVPAGGYYYSGYYPSSESSGQRGSSAVGHWTDACPLCGGSGTHSHEHDGQRSSWYEAEDLEGQHGYGSQGRARRRSRSVPRSRHYSPSRRSWHSYRVREVKETDSEDSDDWERVGEHRRSRSWSRQRSRSQPRHSSRHGDRRHRGKREQVSEQADVDLDESLMLSENIGRLTKKMLGTVRGELRRHSHSQDFSSTYW